MLAFSIVCFVAAGVIAAINRPRGGPRLRGPFALALAVLALPIEAAKPPTVGDLVSALMDAGVTVEARALPPLIEPLTEGRVVQVAGAAGLKVTTTTPYAAFTQDRLPGFVAWATSMRLPASNGKRDDHSTQGNGKKKGHTKSPSTPE